MWQQLRHLDEVEGTHPFQRLTQPLDTHATCSKGVLVLTWTSHVPWGVGAGMLGCAFVQGRQGILH